MFISQTLTLTIRHLAWLTFSSSELYFLIFSLYTWETLNNYTMHKWIKYSLSLHILWTFVSHDSTQKNMWAWLCLILRSFLEWDKLLNCSVIGRRMKGKIDSSMDRWEFWNIYQTQLCFLLLTDKFVNKKTKLQEQSEQYRYMYFSKTYSVGSGWVLSIINQRSDI